MKHDEAGPERGADRKEMKFGYSNHSQRSASVFHWISRRAGEGRKAVRDERGGEEDSSFPILI